MNDQFRLTFVWGDTGPEEVWFGDYHQISAEAEPQHGWTVMTANDYTAFATPLAHPGEHLREDFLPEYNLTPGPLAKAMGLKDRTRIERLVR